MDIISLMKVGESYGPHFLIFIVLVLFMWYQNKAHMRQLNAMEQREGRAYEQNKETLQVLQQLVAQQSRIETKMDSNQFCPITRRESGK